MGGKEYVGWGHGVVVADEEVDGAKRRKKIIRFGWYDKVASEKIVFRLEMERGHDLKLKVNFFKSKLIVILVLYVGIARTIDSVCVLGNFGWFLSKKDIYMEASRRKMKQKLSLWKKSFLSVSGNGGCYLKGIICGVRPLVSKYGDIIQRYRCFKKRLGMVEIHWEN
ncbi:hypothetical protein CR513_46970, partial [Mucuna pruriens]